MSGRVPPRLAPAICEPGAVARLFLAVGPPPSVRAELVRLQAALGGGVRLVPPEQFHVTLRFWGEADPEPIQAALDDVTLPRATALLGPEVRTLGRDAVVVPVAGLDGLAATVDAATAGATSPATRVFRGHVTIARRRRGASCDPPSLRLTTSFEVREVELVLSELGPDGARHRIIASWPTNAPDGGPAEV